MKIIAIPVDVGSNMMRSVTRAVDAEALGLRLIDRGAFKSKSTHQWSNRPPSGSSQILGLWVSHPPGSQSLGWSIAAGTF